MKYKVPQSTILSVVVFIIHTLILQNILKYYDTSYHIHGGDRQIYFRLDSKGQCVSNLNTNLNAVQTWIFRRKLTKNKDKTSIMIFGNPIPIRKNDFPWTWKLNLDQYDINLSTNSISLGVVWLINIAYTPSISRSSSKRSKDISSYIYIYIYCRCEVPSQNKYNQG